MILWLWYSQSHLRTPHTIDSNFSLFINCQQWQHLQFVWLFFIPLVFLICFCGWLSILLYQPYRPMLFRTQTHMLWQQTNALWTAQVLSKTIWWSKVIIKNFSLTLILMNRSRGHWSSLDLPERRLQHEEVRVCRDDHRPEGLCGEKWPETDKTEILGKVFFRKY